MTVAEKPAKAKGDFAKHLGLDKRDSIRDGEPYACCCLGPQNGDPLCPCKMREMVAITRGIFEVSAPSCCPLCLAGHKRVGWRLGAISHRRSAAPGSDRFFDYTPCADYDSEGRHLAEPLGFYTFAWWPKICRNGKRRWLTWVERHEDGSFTAGNRAF